MKKAEGTDKTVHAKTLMKVAKWFTRSISHI